MIVCPVCEHPQAQGAECEVCGKRLVAGVSAADLAIPAVEGLEPTRVAPVEAPAERVLELEPTFLDVAGVAAAAPALDVTPDLEATRAAPVDVDVAPAPDVERTAMAIPDDAPTAVPAFATCRYCRTPAMPGERICSRCGMRLPVVAVAAAGAGDAPVVLRTCTCGATVRPDASLCPACGARLAH
jgi:hypothetical protein